MYGHATVHQRATVPPKISSTQIWLLQDTSNSGANVKRLDQESKDQMKEIESSIAAKKKEVGSDNLFLMVPCSMHVLPV